MDKSKESKKAETTMTTYIILLIIGLAAAFPAMLFAGDVLDQMTGKVDFKQSFLDLTLRIQGVDTTTNSISNTFLIMKDDTFIVGLDKDADFFKATMKGMIPSTLTIMRPTNYENLNILCLCVEYDLLSEAEGAVTNHWTIQCTASLCEQTHQSFINELLYSKDITNPAIQYEGGFMLQKEISLPQPRGLSTGFTPNLFKIPSVNRVITIQTINGKITVCTEASCITDDMKNTHDPVLPEEVPNHVYNIDDTIAVDYREKDGMYDGYYQIDGFTKNQIGEYFYTYSYFTDHFMDSEELPEPLDMSLSQFENLIADFKNREYVVSINLEDITLS